MNELTNVTTGEVRLSYVHLFKPYAFLPGQEEKFCCTVLVPKTDINTMTRINNAIAAATERGVSDKWNGVRPPVIQSPLHDGDGAKPADGTEYGPECKGHWVINASAKTAYPPEVVDANMNPIINQSEIYSGIYGKVCLSFFPYAFGGKKGIGCGLGPVQKIRDGESLGGSAPTAAQAFGAASPATPGAYGVAPAPAAGVYGGIARQPYAAPYSGQAQPVGYTPQYSQPAVNPVTGMPY